MFYMIGAILFLSCENDLREVDRITNVKAEENVNISKHVTVIYSDSARVKAELTSPELREYPDSTGMYEFKKGVVIRFFDEFGKESQRVKADYANQNSTTGLTTFRKNVVVNMSDGSVIKTEELFYDEKKERYYNSVPITFDFKDQRGALQALSFSSDAQFKHIEGESMTGFFIPSGQSQLPAFGN